MSEEKKQNPGEHLPDNVISLASRRNLKKQKDANSEGLSSETFPAATPQSNRLSKPSRLKTQGAILGAIILTVTLLNQNLWVAQEQATEFSSAAVETDLRGPASLSGATGVVEFSVPKRDTSFEKQLVAQLIESKDRGPASLGQAPSLEQRLRYELLENKYSLELRKGKLFSIRYISNFGLNESPNYIHDREQFLLDFRDLLPADFLEPVALGRDIASEASGMIETYVLIGEDGIPSGRVVFDLDEYGRLIEMKVETR